MKYAEALKLIGGLSRPSKMPWYAWSISATDCITGGKLQQVDGSICHDCYAMKGFYRMGNVKAALDRRKAGLEDPNFVKAFVTVLSELYDKQRGTKENRFRWHDSGDLQSVEHLDRINQIALATPFLQHWLPTKEMTILRDWLKDHDPAPNLTIKPSTPMVGDKFKSQPFGLSFTTVGVSNDSNIHPCSAPSQGNKCLDCRLCWQADKNVNYSLH